MFDPGQNDRPIQEFRIINKLVMGITSVLIVGTVGWMITPLDSHPKIKIAGLIILLCAVLKILELIPALTDRLQLFSDEIHLKSIRSTQILSLDELTHYTANIKDIYVNGVYTISQVHLKFRSVESDQPDATFELKYNRGKYNISTSQSNFLQLQEAACQAIGLKLLRNLHEQGSLEWTMGVTIYPSYLKVCSPKSPVPVELSLTEIANFTSEKGRLIISDGDDELLRIDTSRENFFPHLWVAQWLCDRVREMDQAEEPNDENLFGQNEVTTQARSVFS